MRLTFITPLVLIAALLLPAPFPFPAAADSSAPDEAWLQKSKEILENPANFADLPTPKSLDPQTIGQAKEVVRLSTERILSDMDKTSRIQGEEAAEGTPDQVIIFITFGDPVNLAKVRQLAVSLSREKFVVLAIRGLPAGARRIDEVIKLFGQAIEGLKEPPGLVIDAKRFKDYQIENSPTIMVERDGRPLVWAEGVSDPDWIRRKAEQGESGALGIHGETEKIAEISLFQTIAERIAQVDWQAKKDAALKRFWNNRAFLDFPTANEERAFTFEPEFQVTQDMTGAQGEVLARAGQVINPVAHIAGTFYLVVFDAGDERQVKLAKQLGDGAPLDKRVKFIATSMDPGEDGWKEKTRIENCLNAPLYFLDTHQASILRLEHVPSTVQTRGDSLLVVEYPIPANL